MLELSGDLGAGKTTFMQALAAALGFAGLVTSPTFALSQIYALPGGHELHHYDLYRLDEAGVVGEELAESIADPQAITVVEWADIAAHQLPLDRLSIALEATGETERHITITAGGARAQRLLEALRS